MIEFGLALIDDATDDPEDTMLVSLTRRQLALIATGQVLLLESFPFHEDAVCDLTNKLHELGVAQEFLQPGVFG